MVDLVLAERFEELDLPQAAQLEGASPDQSPAHVRVDEERNREPAARDTGRHHDLMRDRGELTERVQGEHVAEVADERVRWVVGIDPVAGTRVANLQTRTHGRDHDGHEVDVSVGAGAFHVFVSPQGRVVDRTHEVVAVLDPAHEVIGIAAQMNGHGPEETAREVLELVVQLEQDRLELRHLTWKDVLVRRTRILDVPELHVVWDASADRLLRARRGIPDLTTELGPLILLALLQGHVGHEDLTHEPEGTADESLIDRVADNTHEPEMTDDLAELVSEAEVIGITAETE